MRKSVYLRFSYRPGDEGDKYFPVQTEQKDIHYMAYGSFSSLIIAPCSFSDFAVYFTPEILGLPVSLSRSLPCNVHVRHDAWGTFHGN